MKARFSFCALFGVLAFTACGHSSSEPTRSSNGAIEGNDNDVCQPACGAGQECEDGVCVADDDADDGAGGAAGAACTTDADCAAGEECDDGACKADGGDDGAGGNDDGAGGGDGGAGGNDDGAGGENEGPADPGVACTTDADCQIGEECHNGFCEN